jgi:methionyl-tRNA formyltransferase
MEPRIDAGPIALKKEFVILPNDTGLSLFIKCSNVGAELVLKALKMIDEGEKLPKIPQDLSKRFLYRHKDALDGSVRWKMTAKEIINLVRALDYSLFTSPTTSPTASINGMQIIIRKARIIDNVEGDPGKILSIVDDGIIVGSGNNKSVMLTMVECPDKGTLSGIEIGSSLSINLGDKFKIVD